MSKALEHVKYLESVLLDDRDNLENIEKELKALEILKKHNLLNLGLLDEYNDCEYEDYSYDTDGTTDYLEYEEFRLLKEVLECKN